VTVSDEALAELTAYSFPERRELRNIIERLVILTPTIASGLPT